MKNHLSKRLLSMVLALAMMFTLVVPAAATGTSAATTGESTTAALSDMKDCIAFDYTNKQWVTFPKTASKPADVQKYADAERYYDAATIVDGYIVAVDSDMGVWKMPQNNPGKATKLGTAPAKMRDMSYNAKLGEIYALTEDGGTIYMFKMGVNPTFEQYSTLGGAKANTLAWNGNFAFFSAPLTTKAADSRKYYMIFGYDLETYDWSYDSVATKTLNNMDVLMSGLQSMTYDTKGGNLLWLSYGTYSNRAYTYFLSYNYGTGSTKLLGNLSTTASPVRYTCLVLTDPSITIPDEPDPGVSVTGVTVTPDTLELKLGETGQLTATVTPEDATDKTVSWTSSKPEVATVDDNGLVTAVAPGQTAVTVTTTDGSFTATCTVTVVDPVVKKPVLMGVQDGTPVTVTWDADDVMSMTAGTALPGVSGVVSATWNPANGHVFVVGGDGVLYEVTDSTVAKKGTCTVPYQDMTYSVVTNNYQMYGVLSYAGKYYLNGPDVPAYFVEAGSRLVNLASPAPVAVANMGAATYNNKTCDKLMVLRADGSMLPVYRSSSVQGNDLAVYTDLPTPISEASMVYDADSDCFYVAADGTLYSVASNGVTEVLDTYTGAKLALYSVEMKPVEKHTWDTPSYLWSADYSTCTATRTCTEPGCTAVQTAEGKVEKTVTKQPTCTEKGEVTYTATFDVDWASEQTEFVDLPATGHTWGEVTYTWGEDYASCTAERICSACSEKDTATTTNVTATVVSAPTCNTSGLTTYTATFAEAWADTYEETVDVPPTEEHDWSEASYEWTENEDGTWSCTASRTCSLCKQKVSEEGIVTSKVTKEATCSEAGEMTYTATFPVDWAKGDTKVVEIPALPHTWGDVSYVWTETEDGYTCTAERTCSVCGEKETAQGTVTSEVTKPATCTEAGEMTYTATFTADWAKDDTKTVAIPAAGHTWGKVTYTWADDYSTCTAQRTCSVCGEKETAEGTVTAKVTEEPTCTEAGVKTYTATFEAEWAKPDTKTEDLPALGHDWGVPSYTWTETADGYTCTAKRVCKNNSYHFQSETVVATGSYREVPLPDKPGVMVYEAMFKADWADTMYKEVPGIPVKEVFPDVEDGRYYYYPVYWALAEGLTTGMPGGVYEPGGTCTRAQMVTFLWRLNGAPEPTSFETDFTDLNPNAYYYKAVLWAVENGITKGVTTTTFVPDAPVTRQQTVVFLYRAAGKPTATITEVPFTDLDKVSDETRAAVLWAYENEIVQGMTKTTFEPLAPCTRGQTVTFLYRCFGK